MRTILTVMVVLAVLATSAPLAAEDLPSVALPAPLARVLTVDG